MLGAFAVGKTSLVQQFAYGLFSEKYHTTVGVRIEKKQVTVDNTDVNLLVWDLHGEDAFQEIRMSYLRGSAGLVYVVDGQRRETVATILNLHVRINEQYPDLPAVVLLNKSDFEENWEVTADDREKLQSLGMPMFSVSAKTAAGVDDAFIQLALRTMSN